MREARDLLGPKEVIMRERKQEQGEGRKKRRHNLQDIKKMYGMCAAKER